MILRCDDIEGSSNVDEKVNYYSKGWIYSRYWRKKDSIIHPQNSNQEN